MHIERESEEGSKLLKQLNHFAIHTDRKSMSFWWLLPVMDISNFEKDLSHLMQPEVARDLERLTRDLAEI